MMAGSHVALGAAAWLVAAPRLGLPGMDVASLGLAVAGALLPDVDHPKSWVGSRLRPVSDGVAAVFGHRGVTHSAAAVGGCAWLLLHRGAPGWPGWWGMAPLAVGYLSHLAADLLTPAGLRLLWPLRRTTALPVCRTGGPFEPLVVALLLCWAGSGNAVPPLLRDAWHRAGAALPAALPTTPHGDAPPRRAAGTRVAKPPA